MDHAKLVPDLIVLIFYTVKMNESTRLHGEEYKFPEDNPGRCL